MATLTSDVVVFTEDKLNLPLKDLMEITKQRFKYGFRDINIRDNKVVLKLKYSPKAATLKKKFRRLPVLYMRVNVDNDEEFSILEKVVKRFKFNLVGDDADVMKPKKQKLEITTA